MLIDCPDCAARVHGKVLAEREYGPTPEYDPRKYVLLECPSCHEILLGMCDYDIFTASDGTEQEGWSLPKRLWPDPQKSYDFSIPHLVRNSLEDAKKCFEAKVYTACAVMCGRALEAICNEKTGESSLARGLQKLNAHR